MTAYSKIILYRVSSLVRKYLMSSYEKTYIRRGVWTAKTCALCKQRTAAFQCFKAFRDYQWWSVNRKVTADLALQTWAWERKFDRQSKPIIESSPQSMAYQTMVVRYFGMTTIMNGSPSGISSKNGPIRRRQEIDKEDIMNKWSEDIMTRKHSRHREHFNLIKMYILLCNVFQELTLFLCQSKPPQGNRPRYRPSSFVCSLLSFNTIL